MAGRYCLPLPSRSSFWVADLRDDLIEFFIRAYLAGIRQLPV